MIDVGIQVRLPEPKPVGLPVQAALPGIWRRARDGCPHYHTEGCDFRGMQPCLYDGGGSCPIMKSIIEEWKEVYDAGQGRN